MLLRGQTPQDQLEFDTEIERTARRNHGRRKREQRTQESENETQTLDSIIEEDKEEINMANAGNNPPQRILGDYAM